MPAGLRPPTPDSPATISSLRTATANIDDLTAALSNFSRAITPDSDGALACCCSEEDCSNLKEWLDCKSKLESRLILSAEIGQALLHKHEAYVRQNESGTPTLHGSQYSEDGQLMPPHPSALDDCKRRVTDLEHDNAELEKRLAQALVNVEIQESQHKSILAELREAHASVSKLTAHHARTVGVDARLSAITHEKEDLQQERDAELQRARTAEARSAYLKEKCLKLQADVLRLQEDLDHARSRRSRLSEEILQDARERLELLQYAPSGHDVATDSSEVTRVLESLVADNEALKRDNAELQNLLTESREDLRTAREELEEHKARMPVPHDSDSPSRPLSLQGIDPKFSPASHSRRASQQLYLLGHSRRHSTSIVNVSVDHGSRRHSPPTPDSAHHPLSPPDSVAHGNDYLSSRPSNVPPPKSSPLHKSYELDSDSPESPEKPRSIKPLFLLAQSRGVQTDPAPAGQSPLYTASETLTTSTPPPEGRSESSSLIDGIATFTVLVERLNTLLTRMTQADALSLTNRLKRQHLQGADVGHLSRTTVNAIITEAGNLRGHFRAALDDEKVLSTCSRKDLRALLKLIKDMFTEYGQLRVTLNDVILDPSCAYKVSQAALEPAKAEAERGRSPAKGWMAPISRLFSGTVTTVPEEAPVDASVPSPVRTKTPAPGLSKAAPKLAPVTAASTTTTVAVEFSSSGNGRAITSTHSAHPSLAAVPRHPRPQVPSGSGSLMGIFAGAPRPATTSDAWIVVPPELSSTRTHARMGLRSPLSPPGAPAARMSRNVDAMVDEQNTAEGAEFHPRLLERTLRPRGLSDSSIHTTFLAAGGEHPRPAVASGDDPDSTPDRQSVMNAVSARVQGLRFPSALGMSISSGSGTASEASSPTRSVPIHAARALSPGRFLPNLSNWAAAVMEPHEGGSPGLGHPGSVREDGVLSRQRVNTRGGI